MNQQTAATARNALYIHALKAIMLVNAGAVRMRDACSMWPRSSHTAMNAGTTAANASTIAARSAAGCRKPGRPRMNPPAATANAPPAMPTPWK